MTAEERAELVADIISAIHAATPPITEDETRWVRQAILGYAIFDCQTPPSV